MSTGNFDSRTAAGAFACVILLTLPFSHSVAIRTVSLGLALVAMPIAWRSLAVPRIPLLWLFALWTGLGLLSLVWAVDRQYSASELKSEALYSVLVFVLFFALSDIVWLERFRRVVLAATALSFASVVYWGLFLPPYSTQALFSGPGMYSTFLIAVYPYVLVWLLKANATHSERIVHWLLLIGIVVGGAITLNRMFWIVLGLQTLVVLWLRRPVGSCRSVPRRLALSSVAVALAFGGALYAISSKRFAVEPTMPEAVGDTMATDIRFRIWKAATGRIAEHPVVGAGFGRGSLRQEFRTEFGGGLFWHAHNTVLNYGLSMGLPGVIIVLLLFGVVLHRLVQIGRSGDPSISLYAAAGIAMVVGMLVKNMTDDLFIRQNALLYWSLAGMTFGAAARRRAK